MIAGLLFAFYTAHPAVLLGFGFAIGVCSGFLLGTFEEQRWWRTRVHNGAIR